MKNNITLTMIVKNEEKYLGDCLKSVKGIADEIIVVDTGSVDKTIEIASAYGAKIYNFEWCNDFAAARNFALSKSTGEWILYLDADERLAYDCRERLLQAIEKYREGKFAFRTLVNSIDEIRGNPKLMKYTRIFKNSEGICFKGRVHEQIDDSLLKEKYVIIDSDIEILHLGYNIEKAGIFEKAKRNLELLLQEYSFNPSSYYEYHLGITYNILGKKSESANYFSLALKDNNLNKEYRAISHLNLAVYYSSVQYDFSLAEKMLQSGMQDDADNIMLYLVASEIYGKTGQTNKALRYCRQAFEKNKKMTTEKLSSSIFGVLVDPAKIVSRGLFLAVQTQDQEAFEIFLNEAEPHLKAFAVDMLCKKEITAEQVNWATGEINEFNEDLILLLCEINAKAESVYNLLLKISDNDPSSVRYLMALGNFCQKNNDLNGAVQYYKKAVEIENSDPSPLFYLISVYVALNDFSPIPELLDTAEKKFGDIPLFKEKMEQLKQKLFGVLR